MSFRFSDFYQSSFDIEYDLIKENYEVINIHQEHRAEWICE